MRYSGSNLRGTGSRAIYLCQSRADRRGYVRAAQCSGDHVGYLHEYQADSQRDLARIRKMPGITRAQRMKRKAEFFATLARMAERADRIKFHI